MRALGLGLLAAALASQQAEPRPVAAPVASETCAPTPLQVDHQGVAKAAAFHLDCPVAEMEVLDLSTYGMAHGDRTPAFGARCRGRKGVFFVWEENNAQVAGPLHWPAPGGKPGCKKPLKNYAKTCPGEYPDGRAAATTH